MVEACTLVDFDGKGISIYALYFDEAIGYKDDDLEQNAQPETQPEGPNISLSIREDDADAGDQDDQ